MSKGMNGCDLASYQWDIEPSRMTTTKFMIIKATQGTWYVNPYFKKQYAKAKAAGKLLGAYHYGEGGDPVKEARYCVKVLGDKIGECVIALDHEGKSNRIFNTSSEVKWCNKFAEEIYRLTGVHVLIYMSKGVTRRRDWSIVSSKCKLWCAQYPNNISTNYLSNPWTDEDGFGSWKSDTIRQYTSHGRVRGYDGNLDLDLAYLTEEQWKALAKGDKGKSSIVAAKPKTQWSSYIYKTTSPVKISNSGSDENGAYHGGKAGDQTGREWQIRNWYNRPWNCVLRHPLAEARACLATLAVKAAENNNIGYDQYQRESYGKALEAAGWDPSKIKERVESDCSRGVVDNIIATGHILGIKELQRFEGTYTGNMRAAAKKAGFQILTAPKYLTSSEYLLAGDILLNDAHHTCTVITNGSKSEGQSATPYETKTEEYEMLPLLKKGSQGYAVEHLQRTLNQIKYNGKEKLTPDGDFGWKTLKQVTLYQTDRGLTIDGEVGSNTWRELYKDAF